MKQVRTSQNVWFCEKKLVEGNFEMKCLNGFTILGRGVKICSTIKHIQPKFENVGYRTV